MQIFWGAGGAHKKNRQLWSGFVCPLILAHYNAQSCPHTVELLTNLREFHSVRRRGEGPQYGPSWFFLSLLGAFSGLLGPFRAFSGPSWGFSDLLGPPPTFSDLLRVFLGLLLPSQSHLWTLCPSAGTVKLRKAFVDSSSSSTQSSLTAAAVSTSCCCAWPPLQHRRTLTHSWFFDCWFKKVTIKRRLVVIFGQFFFIKTVWCHLS